MANARTKQFKFNKPPEPRSEEEIKAEYDKIYTEAADTQYKAYLYAEALKGLNERLKNLNFEASKRRELDAPKKEEA